MIHRAARYLGIGIIAASSLVFAQDPNVGPTVSPDNGPLTTAPSSGGWKRVGDSSTPQQAQAQQPQSPYSNMPASLPAEQQPQYQYPASNYPQPQQSQMPPSQLTVPAGTYLTVRVNQLLSSDRNQSGDAFTASLVQPLVVNGVVVAQPGQIIAGRVSEAQKAGHIEGVARLGIELTDITLVDGQQLPVHTALVSRKGPTSVGQDAGTIAAGTGLGAAIGAAADLGRGAAIGAGAGAAAGIIGVLVTRGHPSIISPEQVLTFQLEAPITIATDHDPQAFRYVSAQDYSQQPYYSQAPPPVYAAAAPPPPPAYYYGSYGYPYPYYGYGYGYPYYYPGFSLFLGGGFYGRGYYGGYYGYRGGPGVYRGGVGGVVGHGAVGGGVRGGGGRR
jgi:hypothetical protein